MEWNDRQLLGGASMQGMEGFAIPEQFNVNGQTFNSYNDLLDYLFSQHEAYVVHPFPLIATYCVFALKVMLMCFKIYFSHFHRRGAPASTDAVKELRRFGFKPNEGME